MRTAYRGAAVALLVALVAQAGVGEEAKKEAKQAEPSKEAGKELIMLELERIADSRDKRQTAEGVPDFSGKEVPPEYLSLLQQLQQQNGEAVGQADGQPAVQQYYIARTPSGVLSGGPLDRSPQRFLPAPGEPRPFRPRDPVLNAISRQNSALQAEYQRKAIRDQETVFLMPRGPVGTDPPRAGPLALAGLYRPGAQPPQPSQGVSVAPGQSVGLAQPAFNAHDSRLRAALQGADVIQAPQPQYISPQYVQQLQARGLAALSGGPASELSLVREDSQQLQSRPPPQLQFQPAPRPPPQPQYQPQPQASPTTINFQELSPAELRFVQRQQADERAPPPQPRYVLQPTPQQLQAQIEARQVTEQLAAQQQQRQQEAEEQYLRETTPGGPPPLPAQPQPGRAFAQPENVHPGVLQPSPLYLQQVQQLAEQQALARQQLAAVAQQQQPSEEVQYVRQPQRYVARPAPSPSPSPAQGVPLTTPRSTIYVSTATARPKAQPAGLRPVRPSGPGVTLEQLLAAGEAEAGGDPKGLPVVRLPSNAKALTQADLQQLIDAGFDVSPVADARDPTASVYYRSSAAGDYQQQQAQRFAPIVVPDDPRLSDRQRQALPRALLQAQAQEEAYLQAQAQAQAQGRPVRLGSSGN